MRQRFQSLAYKCFLENETAQAQPPFLGCGLGTLLEEAQPPGCYYNLTHSSASVTK